MPSASLLADVRATLNTLRRRSSTGESIRSIISSGSTKRRDKSRSSSYRPYSVYDQTMAPSILRDHETTRKLLEAILDSPNGKRTLSRLARTCRAMRDVVLAILWRDLDSLIPILGLFPNEMLRKARKPGMGMVSTTFSFFADIALKLSAHRQGRHKRESGPKFSNTARSFAVLHMTRL